MSAAGISLCISSDVEKFSQKDACTHALNRGRHDSMDLRGQNRYPARSDDNACNDVDPTTPLVLCRELFDCAENCSWNVMVYIGIKRKSDLEELSRIFFALKGRRYFARSRVLRGNSLMD
jgi:hypothetical protein